MVTLGLSDEPVPVVLKELILKEAKLITSRVSHGEFAETLIQLEQGNFRPDRLISAVLPVSEISGAFNMLKENPSGYLKILLQIGKY